MREYSPNSNYKRWLWIERGHDRRCGGRAEGGGGEWWEGVREGRVGGGG